MSRVRVSLSDRERHDWRDQAACKAMDPRDFDDGGTPVAWEACRDRCDVLDDCRTDCFQERPRGVYRAGRYWPESERRESQATTSSERRARWLEWAELRELGMSLPQIAKATGYHHATVLNALRKMGVA